MSPSRSIASAGPGWGVHCSFTGTSHDPEVVDERAAAPAGEGTRTRHPLARRGGDGERGVPLAPETEAGQVGPVLHEDRAIATARHRREGRDVVRVHRGGV